MEKINMIKKNRKEKKTIECRGCSSITGDVQK